ncbi:866_t:CDS:1 [Ambispora gerdemannii]|uniref:866_t:CDS:1 n=1 Tax=Ambispora gerdemannii TaxID=144530 RepID=A0A9N9GYY3_9GLOM|nr:866_t:CDS:1 [Ambispora gerdemannii]
MAMINEDSSQISLTEEQESLLLDLRDQFRSIISTCVFLETVPRRIRTWINEKNQNVQIQITEELLFSTLLIGVSEKPLLFESLLAFFYDRGIGTTQDRTQALELYERSANTGDPLAQNELGFILEHRDPTLSQYWYHKAAKSRWPDSFDNLGRIYFSGNGVNQDFRYSVYYFRLGAGLGLANSQLNLGLRYQSGDGVVKDLHSAIHWFHKVSKNSQELEIRTTLQQTFRTGYYMY